MKDEMAVGEGVEGVLIYGMKGEEVWGILRVDGKGGWGEGGGWERRVVNGVE